MPGVKGGKEEFVLTKQRFRNLVKLRGTQDCNKSEESLNDLRLIEQNYRVENQLVVVKH